MTVNLSALAGAGQQFFDNNGNPLSGGKLYSYEAGTTTPQTTYTTAAGNVAHSNPIILDSAGRVPSGQIWLTAGLNYKFVLKTSTEVQIATWDNITGINGTGITSNAINVEYDPAGLGAVPTNVQDKLRESVSVKDFGAVGDGVADDTAAIQAAATQVTSNGLLLFPSGTYKISSDLNISANVIFDDAQVSVNSAIIFTINGLVVSPLIQIFAGAGSVVVSQKTPIIYPEWWGAAQNDTTFDSEPAITKAINNSANNRNVVYFSGNYGIASTVTVPPQAQIDSARLSVIRPSSGSGLADAFILAAGNSLGRTTLPTFTSFSGVVLEVRCNLANIYVPQFNTCGTCIRFNSGHSGVTSNILDTVVEFDAISTCTTAVNFNHNFAADVVQGCGVKGNFITSTINAVVFSGVSVAGKNDGLFLDILAIDFTTGGGAFLDNQTGFRIPRFTANVRSWLGGVGFVAGTPTQFVKGSWSACSIDIVEARSFDQTNFSPTLILSSKIKFRTWAASNAAIEMVPLSAGLAGFNGGKMMHETSCVMEFTLIADVLPGDNAAAYFWHVTGDGDYFPWKMNVVTGAAGLIVERIHDQSNTEAGRVAVSLRNVGTATITTGTTVFLYLERAA
jgi:hypothetical protein